MKYSGSSARAGEFREGQACGKYILESVIGRGGMGTVWRARNVTSGQPVALKVVADDLLAEPHIRARFENEMRRHARLDHPNIVRLLDTFSVNGQQCMVMKLMEGESLAVRLRRGPDHALPLDVSLQIFSGVLRALDYAHRHGIFHRDVKPSNILVDAANEAYLLDFGIALAVGEARLTGMGVPVGTPAYMSPEQIRAPRQIDHRTDVYSAACVLYEMLTGRPPFLYLKVGGTTAEIALRWAHVNERPIPPHELMPSIPPGISRIIMMALNKDPNERPQGCAEFLRLLLAEFADTGHVEAQKEAQRRWEEFVSDSTL
ncbi:MAG TPA: serine/threonine-protein kinase, partial [Nitrosospira sp.]|nr:serine/threonine-protein kinase [Nitrosospira sp.]